ncbi:MAG: hypothetical protein ABL866_16065 [Devosia sp.]
MAQLHYVMDQYYPQSDGSRGFRREVLRIEALDEGEALAEARRVDEWKKTSFYQVRSIKNSARSGDRLIFSSRLDSPDDQSVTPES